MTNISYSQSAVAVFNNGFATPTRGHRALYVGGAGTVVLRLLEDKTDRTFLGVPAGTILPFSVAFIVQAGTTATGLIFLR